MKALYNFNSFPTFVVLVTLNVQSDYSNALKSGLLVWWRTSSLARQLLCHPKSLHVILTYIQRDATLHSLFCMETDLHVSGGTITHHQERKQLYLQHVAFVTPLSLSAAIVTLVRYPQHTQTSSNSSTIAADNNNGVTNTRWCRYICLRSWWWVVVPPKTCRAVSR
jgi:hypothetical protein